MRSFSYTPQAGLSEEFLLHSSNLVLVRGLSYTPWAGFNEEFLLHTLSWI